MQFPGSNFTADIDAAVRRLERRGGLGPATASGAITPELIRAGQRRARALRAEALNNLFTALGRVPRALLRPRRGAAEPTVSTVG